MTEKYGATGRFYDRPELVPFGKAAEEKK
jgi:hypothetical protein